MKEWDLTKQAEANWVKDRPTIDENNTLSDLIRFKGSNNASLK